MVVANVNGAKQNRYFPFFLRVHYPPVQRCFSHHVSLSLMFGPFRVGKKKFIRTSNCVRDTGTDSLRLTEIIMALIALGRNTGLEQYK